MRLALSSTTHFQIQCCVVQHSGRPPWSVFATKCAFGGKSEIQRRLSSRKKNLIFIIFYFIFEKVQNNIFFMSLFFQVRINIYIDYWTKKSSYLDAIYYEKDA